MTFRWLKKVYSFCSIEPNIGFIKVFQWMYLLCIFVHAGYCLFGLVYQVKPFAYFNLFSTVIYLFCTYITRRKNVKGFQITGPIAVLEVVAFVTLSFYCFGWNYGFQFYLTSVIMMLFFFPFRDIRFSMVCACMVGVYFACLLFIGFNYIPRYNISSDTYVYLVVQSANILISLGVIIALTYMFAKLTKRSRATLEQENLALQELAETDPLTGLCNRRSMEKSLELLRKEENSDSGNAVLAILDIDDFKQINDTYGHMFGDRVLVNTANIIQSVMKDKGISCRWGGEEILLLFKTASLQEAQQSVKQLCQMIANLTYACDRGNAIHVTVTCGMSEVGDAVNIEKALEQADANLYIGKTSGKNCVVC